MHEFLFWFVDPIWDLFISQLRRTLFSSATGFEAETYQGGHEWVIEF